MEKVKDFVKKVLPDKYHQYLAILILFHAVFYSIFMAVDKSLPTWDSAGHIALSFRMADAIKRFLAGDANITFTTLMQLSDYYPPLMSFFGAFMSFIFGYNYRILLFTQFIFFVLTVIFVYKVVCQHTKNKNISLLATIIFSLFPQVVDQTHYYHLDIPLTLFMLAATYYLFKSKGFVNFKYTVLFFLFFAFAQLIKWYGFIFLIVPVLYSLYSGFVLKDSVKNKSIRIINLILGSFLFIAVAIPWYAYNWNTLISYTQLFAVGEIDDPVSIIGSLVYYPANVIGFQILFIPFIFLFLGLYLRYRHNNLDNEPREGLGNFLCLENDPEEYAGVSQLFIKKRKVFLLELFYLLIPYIIFSIIGNKNLRYIFTLTPFFAYLIAYACLNIKKYQKEISVFVVLYIFLGSLFLSFNNLKQESPVLLPVSLLFAGPKYRAWYHYDPTFYAVDRKSYPVEEILNYIWRDFQLYDKTNAVGVATLIDAEHISAATLETMRFSLGLEKMYFPVPYFQFEPFRSPEEIEDFFVKTGSKYVIAPTNPGPSGLRNYTALVQCIEFLKSSNNKLFEPIQDFILPNGDIITIYRNLGISPQAVSVGECVSTAGLLDGLETISLTPDTTYIFYTGHFSLQDKIKVDFVPGVLHILQIENTIHRSMLEIANLPKSGSTLCVRSGTNLVLSEEVKSPLVLENQCGAAINCQKVQLTKWNVGDQKVETFEYTRGMFSK